MTHLTTSPKIALIGNGGASMECLLALRQSGYQGEIHLFAPGEPAAANPMLTTYYAAGKIAYAALFPYGTDGGIFHRNRVVVHAYAPVTRLYGEEKRLETRDGAQYSFDQCLIASGATPIRPPVPGLASPQVYTMRTVQDAQALKEALRSRPRKAVVVGASMVGIKLVELLQQAGLEVTLADLAQQVFPLAAHPHCAQVIEARLAARGVQLRLGVGLTAVTPAATGVEVLWSDGSREQGDLLCLSAGVRPNLEFINPQELQLDRGVLVDRFQQTNLPGIYGAGDVAQGTNLLTGRQEIIGLWANARYQGRTAGRNLAGRREQYAGSIPQNITHFFGMDLVSAGDVHHYTRLTEKVETGKRGEITRLWQLFWHGDTLCGANFLDAPPEVAGVVRQQLCRDQNRFTKDRRFPYSHLPTGVCWPQEWIKRIVEEVEAG